MTLPNFILIGAAKCGTTSLCHYLDQHPQIYMSPEKEPRFFAPEFYTECSNGPVRKGSLRPRMDIAEYEALFDGVTNEKALGEASTEYIFFPEAPARIKNMLPDVKLIAILRDPCDRAFSAYCYQLRDGVESTTFEEALESEERRIHEHWRPGWLYKKAGFYFEQLHKYYEIFEPEQLKIYLYEDLAQQPLKVLRDICIFLDVDPNFTPDLSRKNVSAVPQNLFLNKLLSSQSPVSFMKPYLPGSLKSPLRQLKMQNRVSKPNIPSSCRKQLIEIYREDILKLQDLIRRDLSSWMS